jgi:chorismate-pyruvate lyase
MDTGSTTNRLQQAGLNLEVEVLAGQACPEWLMPFIQDPEACWCRNSMLYVADSPWMLACTIFPPTLIPIARQYGNRSLGSWLFAQADTQRDTVHYANVLYPAQIPLSSGVGVMRYATLHHGAHIVELIELFLPHDCHK